MKLPSDNKTGDGDIASAAINRLSWDSAIPVDAVTVKVEKGQVTLTGEVAWQYQREAAADNVRGLTGVIDVVNRIAIKPEADASNIRDKIVDALRRSWFNPGSIQVTADDGKVKLYGSVHSWTERDHAGMTAWAAPGVTSVENDIRVD